MNTSLMWLVLVMVVLIISIDMLFLQHHFWPRLVVNIGIVLIFAGIYLNFFK